MRLQLPKQVHWLLLPPALALLLLFGPLRGPDSADAGAVKNAASAPPGGESRLPESERLPASALRARKAATDQNDSQDAGVGAGASTTQPGSGAPLGRGGGAKKPMTGAGVPQMPDMWQVVASLIGVLLLGVVGLGVLRRVRNAQTGAGRPEGGAPPLALLQSLRLTPKHTVHVVRFDEQVLLLGEAESGLNVLQALPGWQSEMDEREVAGRGMAASAAAAGPAAHGTEDDGAVPRDMVLPRPSRSATSQPKTPRTRSTDANTDVPSPTVLEPQVAPVNDFRTLLQRAKTAIQA